MDIEEEIIYKPCPICSGIDFVPGGGSRHNNCFDVGRAIRTTVSTSTRHYSGPRRTTKTAEAENSAAK